MSESNVPSNLRLAEARDIVASGTSGKSLPVIEFIDAQQAEIERLDGLWRTEKARADFNFEENERLRAALAMVYDKWEDGDPCYEDADPMGSFMGNAFKLSEAEENQILALLPRERGAAETGLKHGD